MKSLITPNAVIGVPGTKANTSSANKTAFANVPSASMKQFGNNAATCDLRGNLTKPSAQSYKAADFTVQMNLEDANKMQSQDRNNFQAIGQKY